MPALLRTAGASTRRLGVRAATRRLAAALGLLTTMCAAAPARALPLDTHVVAHGSEDNDWFGVAVGGGGDVDGDGFPDCFVGAYADAAGGIDGGRAGLFRGGAPPDTSPFRSWAGRREDYLGTAVCLLDWNGDGHADVVIGSPADDRLALNAGSVFVHFGGPDVDLAPDRILSGTVAEAFYGQTVASVGDLDGDGIDDLAVGAWKDSTAGLDAGRVFVYFGGADPDTVADLVLDGESAYSNFGLAVAGGVDVDHDGAADLVVGAPSWGGDHRGRAYLYRGGAALDTVPDLVLTGAAPFANLGTAAALARDFDGDGAGDLVIGAPFDGPINAGRVYVYRGGAVLDTVPDLVLEGDAAADRLGYSVVAADLDRDGLSDVVAAAPFQDAGATNAGRVEVVLGGPGLDPAPAAVLTLDAAFGLGGFALAAPGDLDRDGRGDFVVGSPLAAQGGVMSGRAAAYSLDLSTATVLAAFRTTPRAEGIELAWRLAGDRAEASLERAERVEGPWRALALGSREVQGETVVLDRDVVPGRTYFYRLRVSAANGELRFGPWAETAGGAAHALELVVAGNPARGRLDLVLTVPRPARLSLAMIDPAGRVAAVLRDGDAAAGTHRIAWSPSDPGAIAPGVYWLVLRGLDAVEVRRVTWLR